MTRNFLRSNGAWIGFLVLAIALTVLTGGGFLSARNATNLLRQTAINGVLASGMMLVILTSGIDLSIGSIVALVGILAGLAQTTWGWGEMGSAGTLLTVAMSLGAGFALGSINGLLIAWLKIAPFVITLGMMVIARGLALILSGGGGISPMSDDLRSLAEGFLSTPLTLALVAMAIMGILLPVLKRRTFANALSALIPLVVFAWLGTSFFSYRGFPTPCLILFVTLGVLGFVLSSTTLGRSIYALGANEQAAFWAGVPTARVKWLAYAILGAVSGLAAVLLNARLNSAVPTAGQLFELDAIAAVVIGGTSLKGGTGTMMGTFVGALTIATLNNGMDLLNVTSFYQMVLKGLIIILAVALDSNQKSA